MKSIALLGATCLVIAPVPASAGFFESLFGLAPTVSAPAPPSASPDGALPSASRHRRGGYARHVRHDHRTRVASAGADLSGTPKLQKTTGLLDDPTLRPGDAVMTKDGIRVFAGERGAHHEVDDFVALRDAPHVKKGARIVLASIDDAAHRDIGRDRNAKEVTTGRSAAVGFGALRSSFTKPDVSVRYIEP